MEVKVVPALQDNFMYLLIDTNSKQTAVVDPVEPHKLMAIIESEGLFLSAVLTTHHHFDHSGGNEAIVELRPKLSVYGGDDRIPKLSHKVSHGQELNIGTKLELTPLYKELLSPFVCIQYNLPITALRIVPHDFPYYNQPVYSGHLYITAVCDQSLECRYYQVLLYTIV